jgi:hypothetical protein
VFGVADLLLLYTDFTASLITEDLSNTLSSPITSARHFSRLATMRRLSKKTDLNFGPVYQQNQMNSRYRRRWLLLQVLQYVLIIFLRIDWMFLLLAQIHACLQDHSMGVKDSFPTKELDDVWQVAIRILETFEQRNITKYHKFMHKLYADAS